MNKNYRKVAEAPKLVDILPHFDGRVVRIGTDGSAYYVCGEWSEELKADLEWWETEKRNMKSRMIDKMTESLATARKNLPKMKRSLPKAEREVEEAEKNEQEFLERSEHTKAVWDQRINALPKLISDYLDKKSAKLETEIKDLSPREKTKARRKFMESARTRRTRYLRRLKKYNSYMERKVEADLRVMDSLSAKTETAVHKLEELKKRIGNAKGTIEVYPGKIRDYKRYLATYTPFLDREVMEIYSSEIHPGEFSIIVKGREAGPFWDCAEFRRWKRTGILNRD